MEKKSKYVLERKNGFKKYADIFLNNVYTTHSKKTKEYMGTIGIYDDKLVKVVVKKTIDSHFKKLIECLIKIEESDEDPAPGFRLLLDEVDRFKKELNNKYAGYLSLKQQEFYEKKIALIEKELQNKMVIYQIFNMQKQQAYYEEEEKQEEVHHRR